MGEATLPLPGHVSEHIPLRALGLLPDERLARLAADGSMGAFSAIYERHHQALYRYCRSILGNEEEAKDALQNTMVSALRALPGEQREITLKPWLFRVAHNEAISVLRRRSPAASIDEAGDVAATTTDPEVRERLRTLFEDLRELPERQRGALVMRELNGLGYAAIGAALDSSESAAKQIVYEARCALHELEEGREMACDAARVAISARDGRKLRGRKLRAHLRSCNGCRTFRDSIAGRQMDLTAMAPPLPAPAAAALLASVLGGGGGSAGGGIATLVTGAAGQSLAGSVAVKMAALVVAGIVVVGAGAIVGPDNPVSKAALDRHDAGDGTRSAEQTAPSHGGGQAQGAGAAETSPGSSAGGSWGEADHGGDAGPGESGGPGATPDSPATQPSGEGPPGGGSGGGGATEPPPSGSPGGGSGPPSGGGGPTKPPPGGGAGGGSSGSSGGGPIGTPPGQGGTPPGQGGVPPGLAEPPPGQGGTPPGQGGVPPGQAKPK